MVRLKGISVREILANFSRFQFQNGTIKRRQKIKQSSCSMINFNSRMVRLKGVSRLECNSNYQYFNSRMVRLKGSVKASRNRFSLFQFQNCTIKRESKKMMLTRSLHFNSRMVRLKVSQKLIHWCPKQFQFQNGTIKSTNSFHTSLPLRHFNSRMVRLKVTLDL